MAIPYESKPLPAITTVDFNVDRWAGVNKIKGSQADYEMADCKNMGSGNFPYASPRKPREKLIDEAGIKRIYKVEDDRVYYIDAEDYLCYWEKGVKTILEYKDENDVEKKVKARKCLCTNNYDNTSVFYPDMMYMDKSGKPVYIDHALNFSSVPLTTSYGHPDELRGKPGWSLEIKAIVQVVDTSSRTINASMTLPSADEYEYPKLGYSEELIKKNTPRIIVKVYNSEGEVKKYGDDELSYIECYATVSQRKNEYTLDIPEDITLEDGDYIEFKLGFYHPNNDYTEKYWIENLKYAKSAEWYINDTFATLALDCGVVYNNRIVGVKGNDIRASALGDFKNFQEYADEAGNPSATGAYATDVGSAGDFTGICAYNNILLLFKKDIVYEMYGSMPYTISELCTTGCIDNDSIASVDGVLYWASPKGIVRYSGGVPQVISTQIDIDTSGICKAGTDGRKYYVYDGKRTYVYDTYYQMWHIEDDKNVNMFYNHINDLYAVYDDGIYKMNSGNEAVEWEFETKDYTFGSKERKNLSKLWLRADMPKNSRLEVYVKQNGSEWQRVAVKTAEKDEMFDFKLRVKKCDSFALKFKGKGDVRILDIHGKVTVGTSKHRSGLSLNVYRK